jgi:hypothetical protein
MGTDRESYGNYLSQPLTAEQAAQRELECAKWHAEAALQAVAKAAERAAAAAAKVAHLEALQAQAREARKAIAMQQATQSQLGAQRD